MLSASERQLAIRDAISDRRHTSVSELARDFNVSTATIKRDLDALAEVISIYGTRGASGGIHAVDGWYSSRRYLNNSQEAFLRSIFDGLQTDEDKEMMESILTAFAMPRHKKE